MLDKVANWRRLKVCIYGGDPPKSEKSAKKWKNAIFAKKCKKVQNFKQVPFFGVGGSKSAKFRFFGQVEKTHFFVKISKLKANFWTSKGGVFHWKRGYFDTPRGDPPYPHTPLARGGGTGAPHPLRGSPPRGDPPGPPPGWGGGGSTFSLLPRPRRWCAHHLKRKKDFITWKSCEMK